VEAVVPWKKKIEVAGGTKKVFNEDINNLYYRINIVWVIK
jgi:hypothetical protein